MMRLMANQFSLLLLVIKVRVKTKKSVKNCDNYKCITLLTSYSILNASHCLIHRYCGFLMNMFSLTNMQVNRLQYVKIQIQIFLPSNLKQNYTFIIPPGRRCPEN